MNYHCVGIECPLLKDGFGIVATYMDEDTGEHDCMYKKQISQFTHCLLALFMIKMFNN